MKKQLVLAVTSVAILMAASSAIAVGAGRNSVGVKTQSERTTKTIAPSDSPILLAQVRNFCGKKAALLSVETKDFWVNICGEEADPQFYVGVSKSDNKRIQLPVTGENRGVYLAVNKNVRYMVDTNRLLVTRGREKLVDQRVLKFE